MERAGKHITVYKTIFNYANADSDQTAFSHKVDEMKEADDKHENKGQYISYFLDHLKADNPSLQFW